MSQLQTFEVCDAQLQDLNGLADLTAELFALEHDFRPDREKQLRGLRLILENPDRGRIFVLRDGEQLLGMANALFTVSTAEGGMVILLEDVIVAQSHRRLGLGAQLVEHVLHWAREHGFLRVTLLTDWDNAAALRFYRRLGFARSQMAVLRYSLQAASPVETDA
jgi:GNAT superfamily N-acetyltransferase